MSKDITATVYTETDFRIYIDEWDNGGVWFSLRNDRASIHTPLTRKEAQQMLEGLQSILAKDEVANRSRLTLDTIEEHA
jgi:hypothetical protein